MTKTIKTKDATIALDAADDQGGMFRSLQVRTGASTTTVYLTKDELIQLAQHALEVARV